MKAWILIYVLSIYKAGTSGQIEFNTLKECQEAAAKIQKRLTSKKANNWAKISWSGDYLCLEKTK